MKDDMSRIEELGKEITVIIDAGEPSEESEREKKTYEYNLLLLRQIQNAKDMQSLARAALDTKLKEAANINRDLSYLIAKLQDILNQPY